MINNPYKMPLMVDFLSIQCPSRSSIGMLSWAVLTLDFFGLITSTP
ncbi:MAG: hypothetical protein HN701_03470 [Rhodospirillaceae bacterium]|nr:hypothetical protein [Rhodospirillaceae bacterium]